MHRTQAEGMFPKNLMMQTTTESMKMAQFDGTNMQK